MLSLITYLAFLLIIYSYFGYPMLLSIFPRKRIPITTEPLPRSYTIIVAARNEEAVIAERLENILSVQQPAPTQFIVCSDASDDRTDEIVRSFAGRGVELVRSPERRGKEFAQALAVQQATGEVIVFTDAKVKTEPELLVNLGAYFRDPNVGSVSSIDRVEGEGSGEGMYVRYEMWLRKIESQYYSLVGLSGSCFAVRRAVAQGLRTDVPSDFALLLESIKQGKSGVLAEDVVCTYKAVKTEEQEFARKVRTVLRGITALMTVREVMSYKRYGAFAWMIASHKLGRWAVPWLLIIGTFGAFELAGDYLLWALASVLLGIFYGLAIFAWAFPDLRQILFFKVPLFFLTTNAAILVAWIKYFGGSRSVTWDPSQKAK